MAKVGFAKAACPKCGRTMRARRPAEYAVCDCYKYCPLCDPPYTVPMTPFEPDLTVSAYEAEEHFGITGQEEPSGKSIRVLYICYNHSPPYYSTQAPVEVRLT